MPVDIDTETGLIRQARQVASSNYDARPEGCAPELVVVHAISLPPGQFGGPHIEQLFTNSLQPSAHPYFARIADLRVSAHVLVRRDGELVQFVPLDQRAWHAGESCHNGRAACNDFSIGIELEGDDETPFTTEQYEQLAALCLALEPVYPGIRLDQIVGHCHIAPDRKTDPGPNFDWQQLAALLGQPARDGVLG
ncbi:MAG: 1,6-anhydro-N-acetylmuramyl-L-alanine amidase AmpD [Gammaproteobacteria bacterium]|nr:1,6-anhydro-N-acetylmuramyl-L-alanine amidase AmpD [Gammaproteobacteria bacterium]NNF61033.1 1,6-anhydro-N-acetylmuramyl-L-alanine amidase AmpD [Gammaproteobacteria bacterium]NNM21879.1 1,6-anhydro-N-acetylmuramyl-L-alanine amidase AmpD [Gammaproteobacteria bacterium]